MYLTAADPELLSGYIQVWPHKEIQTSFGEFLFDGSVVEMKAGGHRTGLAAGDWSLTVTELPSTFVSIAKALLYTRGTI